MKFGNKPAPTPDSIKKTRGGFHLFSILLTLLVIGIFVFLNVFVFLGEQRYSLKTDLTQYRIFTLSDASQNVISGVNETINIYTLYPTGKTDEEVSTLLEKYAALNPNIKVQNVDPELNPTFTATYDPNSKGIDAYSVIVTNEDNSAYKVYGLPDLKVYVTGSDGSMVKVGSKAEQKITSALYYIMTGSMNRAVFLSGHGEVDPNSLPQFLSYLDNLNYELSTYDFIGGTGKLDPETDTLFVLGPQQDMTAEEYEDVKTFLSNGGKAMFFMDNIFVDQQSGAARVMTQTLTNFEGLLKLYDIEVNKDYVLGYGEAAYYQNPSFLVCDLAPGAITDSIIAANRYPLISYASSLKTNAVPSAGITVSPLVYSAKESFAKQLTGEDSIANLERQPGDATGNMLLGAFSAAENGSQIVVFGSSSLLGNNQIQLAGNADLVMNSLSYLNQRTQSIDIAPKRTLGEVMQFTSNSQVNMLIVLCVIVIPALLLLFGVVTWVRRVRR